MTKRVDEVRKIARSRYWRGDQARVVVGAWRASGLSLAGFARRYELAPQRIARWAAKLDEPPAVRFHPVRLVDRSSALPRVEHGAPIELVTPDDLRIRVPHGTDPEHLRRVLDVLQGADRC